MRYIVIAFMSLFSMMSYAAKQAEVSLDKSWGLLIGDEFKASVLLPPDVASVEVSTLPQTGKRYGNWLFLKNISLDGQLLLLDYQVVNVPSENQTIETPVFSVADKQGKVIAVPAKSLVIGPLLPAVTEEQYGLQPKPDHPVQAVDSTQLSAQLQTYIALAMISGLVLVLWHFGWKPRNRAPFAQAIFELTVLRFKRDKDAVKAARIIHKAFNQAQGTVVVVSELDQLFTALPWLQPLQTDISDFYARSTQQFFSREQISSHSFDDMLKLARACRAKEKLV